MWREMTQREHELEARRPPALYELNGTVAPCGLCENTRASCLFEINPFAVELPAPGGPTIYLSGRKLPACRTCRAYVERDSWGRCASRRALPLHVHERLLWDGYRDRITGEPSPIGCMMPF